MMKRMGPILALTLILVLGAAMAAQAAETRAGQWGFYVGGWLPAPTGTIQSGTTSVDLSADLGLRQITALQLGMKYYFAPDSILTLGYYGVNSDGSNTLGKGYVFNNVNYVTGDQVNSRAQVSSVDLLWERGFFGDNQVGGINYVLGAKILSASINMDNVTRGTTSSFSSSGILPEIGLSAQGNINDSLGAHARGLWMSGRASNVTGYMIDLNAGLDYSWCSNWSASLDYHWLNLSGTSVDSNNMKADVQFGGPSLTINYRI